MAIIRNPFSLPSELPLYRPREERSYVAWVGVFRSEKNMALLCKIAQALPNIRFRVAGMPTSNTDRATHQALATLAGLSNVEFVGYVRRHQILEFLSGAIALLNTSHSEGFSNTFLESCTVGTPIIARRAADPDLLIATRGLGRSAAVDTELPSCVQEICAMVPEFYREISECCRAYVLAEHAPSDKVEELIAALSPILGRK